ncbi:hypothetical protein DEU56DRAFT_818949 [Suillus clintonianus]|uniref:uncharacterized protein n=1 Tax=Suillus clintonianus TaxID=1904413 RepID=UPI001B8607C2|nr:uncharacterized protein DEU56DRAFT_818949 [Suillus clintonianus]KAG2128557.1 hypothetical protein DEU56DRAFT_818949 [Suillus clintonianus]
MPPPDTAPVVRHTSHADYRTGDLKLGRNAVLADLGRYLQVPFDCLVKYVGAMPSPQDLQEIRNKLTESEILTDDERGLRWTDLTPPASSKESEENAFKPLGSIIAEIMVQVPKCGVSFLANPNGTPLSERNNTSRPDGYLVVNKKTVPKIHWFDIAVPFEFKKAQNIDSLRDDKQKIIWSLHSIMREDPLRRFAFGITIEDTQLRLWLSNRALLAVTEPINFLENIDGVISLFYALGSASASTMKMLGWDPTVERIRDGKDFQYKFTVGDEVFTTTCELATYGADSMVGRGTRVYEATDAEGKKVAIKDSWREAGRQSEGEILENIMVSCADALQPDELEDAKRHFVGVRLCKDVEIDDTQDETLDPKVVEEYNHTWVSIDLSPVLSTKPHSSSTGNIPDSGRLSAVLPTRLGIIARKDIDIPCRVHTRTVFHDVGVTIKELTSLVDILTCLSNALKALYYLHKAGWVHRDFSVGNTFWVEGIGKLGDFEYAKKIDSKTTHGDVRTGTMHFMAVEVEHQNYLFQTIDTPSLGSSLITPPFRMNFLHDIESVWWAFTWIFFYHTDTTTANAGHRFDTQWQQFQLAFPGAVGHTSRQNFFAHIPTLHKSCNAVLSKTCLDVFSDITHFAKALHDGYRTAEAGYPSVVLSDALREDMHVKAAKYLRGAQDRAKDRAHAGVIKLCPLPNLLKQKRPRPGDETSTPSKHQGKKPRHD